jgi:hypothetical protein
MRNKLFAGIGVAIGFALVSAITLYAQTLNTTVNAHLTFDQAAPSLTLANSFQYRVFLNGSTTGQVEAVTCTGTASPFKCRLTRNNGQILGTAAVPGSTHTVTITAAELLSDGTYATSTQSAVCSFRIAVPPATPVNLRFEANLGLDKILVVT